MGQLWIEPINDIIIARVRGVPTEALLKECQERIVSLVSETGRTRILYDGLEMDPPAVEVPISQWKLDSEISNLDLKRAVLVPNTRLAYLARIAFGETNSRVFYNDMTSAINWLSDTTRPRSAGSDGK
jgi:hypothetical protein